MDDLKRLWHVGVCIVFLGVFALANAQTCSVDLRGDLSDEALLEPATGLFAVQLMKQAVELLEPALPVLESSFKVPLNPDSQGFATATFLAERGLLPDDWQPDKLSHEVWQEMLERFAAWYELPLLPINPAMTQGQLISNVSDVITRATENLRPVALVAAAEGKEDEVAFWAILRKRSVYPRLIVFRPPTGNVGLSQGVKAVLPLLESCSMNLENFIFAPVETAQRLFLDNNRASMVVIATAPEPLTGLSYVPEGEESAYFTFNSDALESFDAYAAVFSGPSVAATTLLRLVPQVRTNMNPREIVNLLLPN